MTIASISRAKLLKLLPKMEPDERRQVLIARMRTDVMLFCTLMLPNAFRTPFSTMHREFLNTPKVPWQDRTTKTIRADAAPREGAKSTCESYAQVLHDIVYGYEAFVAIISATQDQSDQLAKRVYDTLKFVDIAPEFHDMFGPFDVDGGKTNFIVKCKYGADNGTRVWPTSLGGQIRSQLHGDWRPTKVIVDDYETAQGVKSPTRRKDAWSYWVSDILKSGGNYTIYRVVGTVLHPSAMLPRVLKSPSSSGAKYQAIVNWPTNMDAWESVRNIWEDLTNDDNLYDARAFYEENKEALDEGAVLLWPESKPLIDMMFEFWEDMGAFLRERQNDPRDPESQIFDIENLRRCTWDGVTITTSQGRKVPVTACEVGVMLDPIPPKDGSVKGDWAGIAVVATDEHGYSFIIECTLTKGSPSVQRDLMWSAFDRFGPNASYAYEANGFAALNDKEFGRIASERRNSGKGWNMRPIAIKNTENKNARIATLEPGCVNGHIEWAKSIPIPVMDQLREFPTSAHDDGPDAIHGAWLQSARGRRGSSAGAGFRSR